MTEAIDAQCPECGPATGNVDADYGFWTCQDCGKSWLLADVASGPIA